jgi:hypothetical protein
MVRDIDVLAGKGAWVGRRVEVVDGRNMNDGRGSDCGAKGQLTALKINVRYSRAHYDPVAGGRWVNLLPTVTVTVTRGGGASSSATMVVTTTLSKMATEPGGTLGDCGQPQRAANGKN